MVVVTNISYGDKDTSRAIQTDIGKDGKLYEKILHEKFTESVLEERNYLLASCLILGGRAGQGREGRA